MVTWIVSWQTFRWCALSGLTITPYKQVPPQLYEMATSTIIVTYPLCVIQNIKLGHLLRYLLQLHKIWSRSLIIMDDSMSYYVFYSKQSSFSTYESTQPFPIMLLYIQHDDIMK